MTKEKIKEIFMLGVDACYNTLNPDNGELDKERFEKLKEEAVKLFYIHNVSKCENCIGNGRRFLSTSGIGEVIVGKCKNDYSC